MKKITLIVIVVALSATTVFAAGNSPQLQLQDGRGKASSLEQDLAKKQQEYWEAHAYESVDTQLLAKLDEEIKSIKQKMIKAAATER